MIALTRAVSSAIGRCELTHVGRVAIDVSAARAQHSEYERMLAALGCTVRRVADSTEADEPELPDSVFIEDIAIVLDEIAVLTRPGAASRRAETRAVETALTPCRCIVRIDAPGTLDGGDVLVLGRTIFVGVSSRTNTSGMAQLGERAAPFGYRVQPVSVHGCLHLKSAITAVSESQLIVNRQWLDVEPFRAFELIDVDAGEPHAANALRIGDVLLFPAAFPNTCRRLEQSGFTLATIDVSELAKAEGAVTCCSLIFTA